MTLELVQLTESEFESYAQQVWESYRRELIKAGASEKAADENISANKAATMPDGKLAEGNYIFNVIQNGVIVGVIWIAKHDAEWFIYDIEIYKSFRGNGLGRSAMKLIEEFVREQNGTELSLSVFGFNQVAQNLYLSEGYEIARIAMVKKLN
ncbi:MAG: GNAT family N-acetyltransferase [Actinomycetales bacterium]|nr:GNAT family N-acetyltransferase [Actinomycetales bacterium]